MSSVLAQALDAAGPQARLADCERSLRLFLRALWGRPVELKPLVALPGGPAVRRASFDETALRLPATWRGVPPGQGAALYRAVAAHASAHAEFGGPRFEVGTLKPIQVALVSLVEDARVEQLALARFPGLGRLWRGFHDARPGGAQTATGLMARLARALVDTAYVDDDAWVNKGRELFLAAREQWSDPGISRRIGGALGNDLGQMRVQFNFRTHVVEPAYRDDNTGLWHLPENQEPPTEDAEAMPEGARPPEEHSAQSDEQSQAAARPEEVAPGAQGEPEAASGPRLYPEWDYLIGQLRPDWCTLYDQQASAGDPRAVEAILERNHHLLQRIEAQVRRVRVERLVRLRRRLDGDTLDLDACINAAVDLRLGLAPDPRVHKLLARDRRDLSVLVLLDLSRSTNDPVPGTGTTILGLAREATALLAEAMMRMGDAFAIHGFWSNTRRQVDYFRVKDFGHAYGDLARGRLSGLQGDFSTRMGCALRHAGALLRLRQTHGRLILLITDGAPSDIDAHDPRYLTADARHAVMELRRRGIQVHCMSLDPQADDYVSRVFGKGHYTVLDRLARLPEKLPLLYLRLAG